MIRSCIGLGGSRPAASSIAVKNAMNPVMEASTGSASSPAPPPACRSAVPPPRRAARAIGNSTASAAIAAIPAGSTYPVVVSLANSATGAYEEPNQPVTIPAPRYPGSASRPPIRNRRNRTIGTQGDRSRSSAHAA